MGNPFIDESQLLKQNDILNYISYPKIVEDNKEFLRSDLWDFEFTIPPAGVYFPGMDLLHARITGVDPNFPSGLSEIIAKVRQFTLRQSVFSESTSGSISINFLDKEDQAIAAFLDDWKERLGSRKSRYTLHKLDTIAEGKLTLLNSSRKPIRVYQMYALQLLDPGNIYNQSYNSDDASNTGEYTSTFAFQHYDLIWKNI